MQVKPLADVDAASQDGGMRENLPGWLDRLLFPDDLFAPERSPKPRAADGVVANARLTASLGTMLVVLFAAEGITLLNLTGWLPWHAGIGVAAAVVVAVKLCSTGYRMLRYYGRSGRYIASGPPHPLMRVLAPFLVLLTIAVIATGVVTMYHPDGPWRSLHKASFIGWIGLAAVHVLVYVWRLVPVMTAPRGVRRGWLSSPILTGTVLVLAVLAAIAVGRWFVGVMPDVPPGGFE